MKKVCMIVQNPMVKGGIAAVVNGYRGSQLEEAFDVIYVESYKDGNKVQKTLKAIKGYFHFLKVIIIEKPDVIHMHTSFGPSFIRSMPFIYMASWAKKPIINHIHGSAFDEFYSYASNKKKKLIRKIYGKCTVIIALSEEWKAYLSQIVDSEKIKILENYSTLHEDALEQRLLRPSNQTVLFLGQIGSRKGCYDIPPIVERLVKFVPDVKFILAGSGELETITRLFEEKGVKDRLQLPGWVRGADKDRLLREADVFFLPSYNEGMPMSILDAMGYGLPIVSTNVGGIPQIIINNKNGLTYKPNDIEGMSDGLKMILLNKETMDKYGKSSIDIVKEKYSLERHIKLLIKIYEEVL